MNQDIPGPLPTKRVFLSEIPDLSPGYKIRFLGCVSRYSVSSGTLVLEHNYRHTPSSSGGSAPQVAVDVNLLLDDLKHTDVQIGSWLNVIGYVRETYIYCRVPMAGSVSSRKAGKSSAVPSTATGQVKPRHTARKEKEIGNQNGARPKNKQLKKYRRITVQAILVIPAGPVRIGEYERVLGDARDVDRRYKRVDDQG